MKSKFSIFLLFIFLSLYCVGQQKVTLKSGETLDCEVTSLINGTLTVKYKENSITLKQIDIEQINFVNTPRSNAINNDKKNSKQDGLEVPIPEGSTIEYITKSATGVTMVLYNNESESRIQTPLKENTFTNTNPWKYTFITTKPNQKLLFHSWANYGSVVYAAIKINGKIVKEGEGNYIQLTVNTTYLETTIR